MKILFVLGLFFLSANCFSQSKYWVYLADKDGVEFDPQEYFDQKAINRRIKNNIPLNHYTDRPIREDYQQQVGSIADTICGHSRWFNALACQLTPNQLLEIEELPFVKSIELISTIGEITNGYDYDDLHGGEKDLLRGQIDWMKGKEFSRNGLTGKGIRICVIDAGFPGVDQSSIFEHLRKNKQIIDTWDFKKNKKDVYKYNSHGSTVLSCIAGKIDGVNVGMATESEFLLARTERIMYEGEAEEEAWLMAVEWADKNGADIINSSLGYTTARHFKEEMDGKTCIITRAGNLAARKGILVVNAAGNDGDSYWKYVGAPADADSVLTIGGINPWTGVHTAFSSYGPTADHRMKPNVSAFGHVMGYGPGLGLHETQGTSFASPLTAGFAACAWQSDTSLTNMELFEEIEKSSNFYPYFDYAHGYGVPQATYFTGEEETTSLPTIRIEESDNYVKVIINDDFFTVEDQIKLDYYPLISEQLPFISRLHLADSYGTMDSNIKHHLPGFFYYHIENVEGFLDEYFVLSVYEKEILKIKKKGNSGKTYRFFYKGTTQTIKIGE